MIVFKYNKNLANSIESRRRLHPLGHLYSEEIHGCLESTRHHTGDKQTAVTHVGILLAEDGIVMIELVVFLCKVIGIVGHDRRRTVVACLADNIPEIGHFADKR